MPDGRARVSGFIAGARLMCGSGTFTMVASSTTISCVVAMTTRARPSRGTGCPGPRSVRGNRPPGDESGLRHEGSSRRVGRFISVQHPGPCWPAAHQALRPRTGTQAGMGPGRHLSIGEVRSLSTVGTGTRGRRHPMVYLSVETFPGGTGHDSAAASASNSRGRKPASLAGSAFHAARSPARCAGAAHPGAGRRRRAVAMADHVRRRRDRGSSRRRPPLPGRPGAVGRAAAVTVPGQPVHRPGGTVVPGAATEDSTPEPPIE